MGTMAVQQIKVARAVTPKGVVEDALLTFEDRYPDVLKEDNLSDILSHLMAKQQEGDTDPDQGMTMVF